MNDARHERAAIVAWMRDPDRADWSTKYLARSIEQGQHLIEGYCSCCCSTCRKSQKPVRYLENDGCPGCKGETHDMEPHPAIRKGVIWL